MDTEMNAEYGWPSEPLEDYGLKVDPDEGEIEETNT